MMKRVGGKTRVGIRWGLIPILLVVCGLAGCATDKSQDTWTVVACWLRPSCLPSTLPSRSPHPVDGQSGPSPVKPLQSKPTPPSVVVSQKSSAAKQEALTASGRPVSRQRLGACQPFASLTVPPERTTVQVSYREPTQGVDGQPLTDLLKTTIFQDSGQGFVKVKDVPATDGKGGGRIQETLPIPGKADALRTIRICVTATNAKGLASAGSP